MRKDPFKWKRFGNGKVLVNKIGVKAMKYRFRFFILCVLGIFYSQQISAVSSCLEAFNGGLKARILHNNGSVREEYVGMEGYALFSEKYMDEKMQKAFQNVSAVLSKLEFERLGWQKFQGTVPEFRAFRNKILHNNGNVKEEYVGMEGYALFSEKYMDEKMQKAFQNVSAALDKAEFAKLGWQSFQGTSVQFHALLEDFIENYLEGYEGLRGQQRVADQIFKGNTLKTYRNVSVLRGYFFGEGKGKDGQLIKGKEFRALDWIRQ